jgi:peptide/nickel transport system substrate-binding protein
MTVFTCKKYFYIFFINTLLFAVLLQGCKNNRAYKDKKIFKYNESAGIVTLDPAFARDQAHIWICNQLYNGLVQLDDNLNVIPSIAKRWSISKDGKKYTFYLRNNVFFHHDKSLNDNKRKVTAYDFEYSFKRLADKKTASPGAWVFSNVKKTNGEYAFKAVNDSVFEIILTNSFPPFLGILTMQYCSVVPKESVEYYGKDFRKHPVGTGPFYLVNWVENIEMVLRKNPNYFEKHNGTELPYLDGVAITFLIDKMTAFMEFVKGNLDMISGITPQYKDELLTSKGTLRKKYHDKFQMISIPYLNTEYLGILVDTTNKIVKSSPLKIKKVRKAINFGFDRKKMIHFLRNGIGTPGNKGIIPKGLPVYDINAKYGYYYSPDSSRKLLKEAGFDQHNPLPPITLTATPEYLDIIKFIQAQLADVGITIEINISPAAAVREMKAHSKLNFFRASWIADYPDAENYLSLFYSPNFAPDGPNYTHYKNPVYDSLYKIAVKTVDIKMRRKIYRQMDSIVMDYSPVVILYYDQAIRFINKNISGMTSNAINLLDLKKVKKE